MTSCHWWVLFSYHVSANLTDPLLLSLWLISGCVAQWSFANIMKCFSTFHVDPDAVQGNMRYIILLLGYWTSLESSSLLWWLPQSRVSAAATGACPCRSVLTVMLEKHSSALVLQPWTHGFENLLHSRFSVICVFPSERRAVDPLWRWQSGTRHLAWTSTPPRAPACPPSASRSYDLHRWHTESHLQGADRREKHRHFRSASLSYWWLCFLGIWHETSSAGINSSAL